MQSTQPLIAGAGPVGLAAALFAARDGAAPRIIDSAPQPSPNSRALAVNPRTLEILEPTGVTERMLAIGKRITSARFARGMEVIGEISLEGLHPKYPYMLALSQAVTQRLLEEALGEAGIHVERGVGLVNCRQTAGGAEADVKPISDGLQETVSCPWLLGADGSHSVVRHAIGVHFEGSSFDQPWHLAEVPLKTLLREDQAHIIFLDGGGFLFLLRVIGEPGTGRTGDPVWRVISNFHDPLSHLVEGRATGPAVWASEFRVAHRIGDRLQQGRICLAGDAAHIHSPMGARGMNLGIEDAWVFSQLVKANRLERYGELRRKVDRRVVRRIEFVSRLVRGESIASRILRATMLPALTRVPLTRHRLLAMLTGLDHPLEAA